MNPERAWLKLQLLESQTKMSGSWHSIGPFAGDSGLVKGPKMQWGVPANLLLESAGQSENTSGTNSAAPD